MLKGTCQTITVEPVSPSLVDTAAGITRCMAGATLAGLDTLVRVSGGYPPVRASLDRGCLRARKKHAPLTGYDPEC